MNLAGTSGGGSTRLTWRQRLSSLWSSQTARWWVAALISQYLFTLFVLTSFTACSQYLFAGTLLQLAVAPLFVYILGSMLWFILNTSWMFGGAAEKEFLATRFEQAGQSIEGALALLFVFLPLVMSVMTVAAFVMEKRRGSVPWRRLKWVALFLLATSLNAHFTLALCGSGSV